jgi:hypothetical protein
VYGLATFTEIEDFAEDRGGSLAVVASSQQCYERLVREPYLRL